MHRQIVYPVQLPLETDLLNTNKNAMIGLGLLAQDALGISTSAFGFPCTPTTPATLAVLVGAGRLYSFQNVDANPYSSLAADTTHQILKQGILFDPVTLACPAPVTSGFSVNYLIQAIYQDADTINTVLPYFNAANPSQTFSGPPPGTGATQPTQRQSQVIVTAKAGIAATTGTQTTPAPDAGNVGLYVVTVANGAATVVAGNITVYPTAPFGSAGPYVSSVRTAAEAAAGVTPVNFAYPPGHVYRYGNNLVPGTTDMAGAINNALASNKLVYAPRDTYFCSTTLIMSSGQTFYGDGSATVLTFSSGVISNISMSGLTGSIVRDMKIVVTAGSGTGVVIGGVYMLNCTACHVLRMEMQGMWGGGVQIDCSNNCRIEANYFHNFNAGGNFGDVMIYCASSTVNGAINNIIINNQCFGGANAFGIALEDPDTATATTGFPRHNLIQGNRIGPHATYGILVYMSGSNSSPPPASDTNNQIIHNYVEGIIGGNFGNTDSGAGIYVVGKSNGGTQVIGNNIFNCCINTTTRTLAPAGIGILQVQVGVTRPTVVGNLISGMSQGDGILLVSSPGGAVISDNSVNMPSTNLGTGPGGAVLLGAGIRIEASSNASVDSNQIQVYGAGKGFIVFANGANSTDITISGGAYLTNGVGNALQVTQAGGFNVVRLTVDGANFQTANATPDAITLNSIIGGNFSNLISNAAGGRALFVNGNTDIRVVGGRYTSTGTVAIGTSGTCTNGFIDETVNFGGGALSLINNAGTGINVEVRTNSIPTVGTWAVGDRADQTQPVVGNPKGWRCTVAGTPGTWVSEGNL